MSGRRIRDYQCEVIKRNGERCRSPAAYERDGHLVCGSHRHGRFDRYDIARLMPVEQPAPVMVVERQQDRRTDDADDRRLMCELVDALPALDGDGVSETLGRVDSILREMGASWDWLSVQLAVGLDRSVSMQFDLCAMCIEEMIERIAAAPGALSFNARNFLDELRLKAKASDPVKLTARQMQWLYALDRRAAQIAEREKPTAREMLDQASGNVVPLRR